MLTTHIQIKDIVKSSGLGVQNITADFYERIDGKVKQMIIEACQRAKENGRKTVMGRDL